MSLAALLEISVHPTKAASAVCKHDIVNLLIAFAWSICTPEVDVTHHHGIAFIKNVFGLQSAKPKLA